MIIRGTQELDKCCKDNEGKIIVIKFTAKWCGPCKKLAPLLEKISETQVDIIVAEISVDDNNELCKAYGVKSIPHCVVKCGEHTSEAIK